MIAVSIAYALLVRQSAPFLILFIVVALVAMSVRGHRMLKARRVDPR